MRPAAAVPADHLARRTRFRRGPHTEWVKSGLAAGGCEHGPAGAGVSSSNSGRCLDCPGVRPLMLLTRSRTPRLSRSLVLARRPAVCALAAGPRGTFDMITRAQSVPTQAGEG